MSNHQNPVPDWLEKDYITKVLKKGLNATTVNVSSLDITPASAAGDNFCCQIIRIKVDAEINGERKTYPIIGKITPVGGITETFKEVIDVFDIEARAFDSLFPKFKKFLMDANFLPDCYHVDFDNKSIFMEDLKVGGYELQPRSKFLNLEQCLLTVEALAKFHGTSWFALQEEPGLKDDYKKTFWDGTRSDIMIKFVDNAQYGIEKNIDQYGLKEDTRRRLLKYADTVYNRFIPGLIRNDQIRALNHGDAWMNNMLFHYDSQGNPDSVRLLDFQIIYYGPFVNDLHYFLFSSASADVLVNHLDQVIEHYYKKLKEVAPAIPNLCLERVQKEFKDNFLFGFTLLFSFRPFIAADAPADLEKLLDGKNDILGYGNPAFIADLAKIMPVLEKMGNLD